MAVKVRCPTCEKVLSAPDAARGKAVKCPGCETKVKVPLGDSSAGKSGTSSSRKSSAKAPTRKAVDPDSGEFLARLDLDNIADSSQAMCPKCGAAIPEDATECPQCGVDPATGQLTASAKKRRSQKGPDPALFYGAAWSDSWAFTRDNKKIAIRTAIYFLLFGAISGGCAFMVTWCDTLPPQVFWGIVGAASFLALPGWVWCLTVETIRVTAAKKTNIRGLHFDIFQNIALGIKSILWTIVFGWFPPAIFMQPLAMVHMAMPVTIKGWLNFALVPAFFRNFAPIMYIWVVRFVIGLVPLLFYGIVAGIVFGTGLIGAIKDRKFSLGVSEWVFLSLAIVMAVVALFAVGFMLVFTARVNGLFAYYFQNSLDLTTFVSEKTYVSKVIKLDRFGTPIRTMGQKVGGIALVVGAFVVVGVAGYFVYHSLKSSP